MPRRRLFRARPRSAPPRSAVPAGLLTVLLVAVVFTAVMLKDSLPGSGGRPLRAVVEDVVTLKSGAPVRVAGVQVGKVVGVDRHGPRTSTVRMELDANAPVVREDAELKVRPRIFLEGNSFVELLPGTPDARALGDGTIPLASTSAAVQVDRLIGTLDRPTRSRLRQTLQGFAGVLSADETVRQTRRLIDDSAPALRDSALIADASRGETAGDLSGFVRSAGALTDELTGSTAQLRGAVRGLQRTMGAFAAERAALSATVRTLPGTVSRLDGLHAAARTGLPALRRISRDLRPGVEVAPETIDVARPWIASARRLADGDALGPWLRLAKRSTPDLVTFTEHGTESSPDLRELSRCVADVLVPALNRKIEDGRFTLGVENYKGLLYGLAGTNGESQNFSGNGIYSRIGVSVGPGNQRFDVVGRGPSNSAVGVRPVRPARRPPLRDDVPCSTQPVPDPNAALSARGVE